MAHGSFSGFGAPVSAMNQVNFERDSITSFVHFRAGSLRCLAVVVYAHFSGQQGERKTQPERCSEEVMG
jgi:hypothetical protein